MLLRMKQLSTWVRQTSPHQSMRKTSQGGNCAETVQAETVIRKGVKLIGDSNLPCSVPNHASALYARNLLALMEPCIKDGNIYLDFEDELTNGCLISHEGLIKIPDLLSPGGTN